MTPIFVRPVREQLEHDRLIRFLQPRYQRKFDVGINAGDEQTLSVKLGANTFFPDLVLMDGKRLGGLVEIETAESTNNLEAMAQWTHFSRARVPFHLYVPVLAVDAAKRLCEANHVAVAEIWTYRAVNDQFDLVRVFHDANAVKAGGKLAPKVPPVVKPVVKAAPPPPPEPTPEPAKPSPIPAKGAKGAKAPSAQPVPPPVPAKAGKAPAKPVVPAKPAPVAKPSKVMKPVKSPEPPKKKAPAKPAAKAPKRPAPRPAKAASKVKSATKVQAKGKSGKPKRK